MLYRDLPTELTRHTWVLLVYAVIVFILVYILGQYPTPLLFFVVTQVPVLLMATYVVFPNRQLSFRLPFFWITAGVIVTGLVLSGEVPIIGDFNASVLQEYRGPGRDRWSAIAVAGGVWALALFWVSSTIVGLVGARKDIARTRVAGGWIASIGAAGVALSFLISTVAWAFGDLIGDVPFGVVLVQVGSMWLALWPLRSLLIALILVGLFLDAAALFAGDPYSPPTPEDVMPLSGSGWVDALLLFARWPLWILVIILGFLVAFIQHLLTSSAVTLERWAAQLYYGLLSLVGGPLVFGIGHWIAWTAILLAYSHVQGLRPGAWEALAVFAGVHMTALLALSIYAAAPVLIGMRWTSGVVLRDLIADTKAGFSSVGKPAAVSVGRAFSMVGVVVVAVPLASLLPGNPKFGAFSWLYTVTLLLVIPYLRWKVASRGSVRLRRLISGSDAEVTPNAEGRTRRTTRTGRGRPP